MFLMFEANDQMLEREAEKITGEPDEQNAEAWEEIEIKASSKEVRTRKY